METPCNTPPTDQDVENDSLIGVAGPQKAEMSDQPAPAKPVRSVNFILDPSAFTLGLGNIERWFDQEYFKSQVKDKNENIHLNLYLPTYTLHELDYQKRGPIVGSTKASEALKFIDRKLESDDEFLGDLLDENDGNHGAESSKKEDSGHFSHSLFLEYRTQQFPLWSSCVKFKIRSPDSKELPLHGKYSFYDEINHFGGDFQENDEERDVPPRLKHLIRSGVYLTRMKHDGPSGITGDMWKLVTEDAVTRVWASCFGIDCLNINEAELLLFRGKDLTKFEIKSAGTDFFSGQDMYQAETPDSLHKRVNTTSYKYTDLASAKDGKTKRVGGKKKVPRNTRGDAKSSESQSTESTGVKVEGGVITEDFNMINFAPREQTSKLVVSKLFAKEPKSKSKPKEKDAATKSQKKQVESKDKKVSTETSPPKKRKPTGKKKPAKKAPAGSISDTQPSEPSAESTTTKTADTTTGGDSKPGQKPRKRQPKKKAVAKKEAAEKKANEESVPEQTTYADPVEK